MGKMFLLCNLSVFSSSPGLPLLILGPGVWDFIYLLLLYHFCDCGHIWSNDSLKKKKNNRGLITFFRSQLLRLKRKVLIL